MNAGTTLTDNLTRVRERLQRAQQPGASSPVRIVAVTKSHPAAAVLAAVQAGLVEVGENRVQEAVTKQDELPSGVARWHLIGHLQTNKAKFIPGRFVMVQSVDSRKIAEALSAAQARHGGTLEVLVQVNVAGEEQKSGCEPAEAADLCGYVAALPALALRGLMTMAPFTEDVAAQRRVFGALRKLRDGIVSPTLALPELSMGMSGDYEAAVAEGATIVRLGTVLFGERSVA